MSGFDRLVIRGTLRRIVPVAGMKNLRWHKQILLEEFGSWAEQLTEHLNRLRQRIPQSRSSVPAVQCCHYA